MMLLLAGFFAINMVISQQDPQITQYIYNTGSINPAYSGTRGHSIITATVREQWIGVDGAPKTQVLSYDGALSERLGLGINVINDKLGPASEIYFGANLSYGIKTGEEGVLALGLRLGFSHLNVDWSKGRAQTPDRIFQVNINEFYPSVGGGVYYYEPNFYLGASIPNFLNNNIYNDESYNSIVKRLHYNIMGGYVFELSRSVKFKPATLVKLVGGAPIIIDLSTSFIFNDNFVLGLGWRANESVTSMIGIHLSKSLLFSLSYDLPISEFTNYKVGTFEAVLQWSIFNNDIIAKSPRFF